MGIPKTTESELVRNSMKFIARLSTMGNDKVVIYVPIKYHKDILKDFKDKDLRVTIEDILED